jgi:cytidine deaminase
MFAAGAAHPGKAMAAIAIAGGFNFGLDGTPCTPCGACRQVMAEYQMAGGKPMNVIMVGADKILKFDRVDDILPFIFDSFTEKK